MAEKRRDGKAGEGCVKHRSLRPAMAWLFSGIAALLLIYVPANMVMSAVAMLGESVSGLGRPARQLILAATLLAIAGATFLLARTIKRTVLRN